MRHARTGNKRPRTGAIAAAAVALALCGIVASASARLDAQAAASSAIPKLTGIWKRKGPVGGKRDPAIKATNRALGFEKAYENSFSPTYDCVPMAMPSVAADNYDFQIEQKPDRVILTYEKMDVVRTIWLEGHGHPKPGAYDYSNQGYSVGHYEGNSLVAETTKFLPDSRGFSSNRFIPNTALKKMTERYTREGNVLKMETTTVDPLALKEPFQFNYEYTPRTDELTKYDCDPEDSRFGAQFHKSIYPPD
jgi:hypothetical protein